METIMEFIKEHLTKIIVGVILFVITFGIYGLYKLYKHKKGS